ncbi:MAG: urease accessory protein UreE [Gammaproteobacteria bacterium]|nr:urease accessory protein UreE [Gammaproteobacteria bacterium]MCP5425137.1 urease accessory protein UreE [Gammaproteobacteria bacterium]MCP5459824.1 urease accessory protein UreE [Gammaproteobacteria bacterium]
MEFKERLSEGVGADASLTLPFESRQKSRLLTHLDDGREARLFLPRGTVLRDGDLLRSEDGLVVRIKAASETVSTARCDDALHLARACYHLGNRHVPVQIGCNWLRYGHDHVLDALMRELGLSVHTEQAPFEPEAGAYSHPAHHEH